MMVAACPEYDHEDQASAHQDVTDFTSNERKTTFNPSKSSNRNSIDIHTHTHTRTRTLIL
jgi:hypothetical protein